MSDKTYKLPKHIAQMVEKNNLVMAIKTLAAEMNISMDEAKGYIDDYEAQLKTKHDQKTQKIADRQKKSNAKLTQTSSNLDAVNAGLDKHLEDIGYKKPVIPYWLKRVLIILLVIIILSLLFWQLLG